MIRRLLLVSLVTLLSAAATAQAITQDTAKQDAAKWAKAYAACKGPFWKCTDVSSANCALYNSRARWWQVQWICHAFIIRTKRNTSVFGRGQTQGCSIGVSLSPTGTPIDHHITCIDVTQNSHRKAAS